MKYFLTIFCIIAHALCHASSGDPDSTVIVLTPRRGDILKQTILSRLLNPDQSADVVTLTTSRHLTTRTEIAPNLAQLQLTKINLTSQIDRTRAEMATMFGMPAYNTPVRNDPDVIVYDVALSWRSENFMLSHTERLTAATLSNIIGEIPS